MENEIVVAVNEAITQYELNATQHDTDSGMCGYAVVLVAFGRKRKLKQQMIDEGVVESRTWSMHGKSYNVACMPKPTKGTQNINYYDSRAKVTKQVLETHLNGLVDEIFVHSWID